MRGVLVSFSGCDQTLTKSGLGRKGVIWLPGYSSSSGEAEAGTWRREVEQDNMEEHCLLAYPHGLLTLLSYKTQDHLPRGGTAHHGLGHPSSLIRKMADRSVWLRQFLSWSSLFLKWLKLVSSWQVLTGTHRNVIHEGVGFFFPSPLKIILYFYYAMACGLN